MAENSVDDKSQFVRELAHLINRYSLENICNTPDYILASYLYNCLNDYAHAVNARDRQAGVSLRIRPVEPVSDNRCSRVLREAGLPYPRTCPVHGLFGNCE